MNCPKLKDRDCSPLPFWLTMWSIMNIRLIFFNKFLEILLLWIESMHWKIKLLGKIVCCRSLPPSIGWSYKQSTWSPAKSAINMGCLLWISCWPTFYFVRIKSSDRLNCVLICWIYFIITVIFMKLQSFNSTKNFSLCL